MGNTLRMVGLADMNRDGKPDLVMYSTGSHEFATWLGNGNGTSRAVNPNDPTTWGKVGRNEACPCGSGKKYKHCHGRFG